MSKDTLAAVSPLHLTIKQDTHLCPSSQSGVISEIARDVQIQHSSGTPDIIIDPPSGGSVENKITYPALVKPSGEPVELSSKSSQKRTYSTQKSNESATLDHVQQQVKKVLKKINKTAYKQQKEIFLARIVLVCAIIFLLSWLPYAVIVFSSLFIFNPSL